MKSKTNSGITPALFGGIPLRGDAGGENSGMQKSESQLRAEIVEYARRLYDRKYAVGTDGNISVRIDENRILGTPAGSCLGDLDSDTLSVVDISGKHLFGEKPSSEMRYHLELYRGNADCKCIMHMHPTWLTLLSCRNDLDRSQPIRPLTAHHARKIHSMKYVPFYAQGDSGIANYMREWGKQHDAFLLANHGALVTGRTVAEAFYIMEECEDLAKLSLMCDKGSTRYLSDLEIFSLKGELR